MASLEILYEDNHIICVVKPPNMPTQQDSSGDLDLVNALKLDLKIRHQKPGNVFAGLVHRLDRPVGGVMVFAKTSKAAARLSDQIRTRTMQKTYLAIVHGTPNEQHRELIDYLVKDAQTNTVFCSDELDPNSKQAILTYTAGPSKGGFTLVAIRLQTGRPHQIRVQLSALGHPLYGDQKYGAYLNKNGQQIALWSTEIGFIHPTLKEKQFIRKFPDQIQPWNRWTLQEMEQLLSGFGNFT